MSTALRVFWEQWLHDKLSDRELVEFGQVHAQNFMIIILKEDNIIMILPGDVRVCRPRLLDLKSN